MNYDPTELGKPFWMILRDARPQRGVAIAQRIKDLKEQKELIDVELEMLQPRHSGKKPGIDGVRDRDGLIHIELDKRTGHNRIKNAATGKYLDYWRSSIRCVDGHFEKKVPNLPDRINEEKQKLLENRSG